jgi:hypothetical protein
MFESPVLSPVRSEEPGDRDQPAKPSESPPQELARLEEILPGIEAGRSIPDRLVSSLVEWVASIGGGSSASAPVNSDVDSVETLAGIDPLAVLGGTRGSRGADTTHGLGWISDPRALVLGGAITLLAAVEGRRWVMRWRNQRAVLRRLRGISKPGEPPTLARWRRVPVGPTGAGV